MALELRHCSVCKHGVKRRRR